ncbi:hypothetical protein L5515_010132 [Caenorhabditis briggsae]|uniref:BZIP domain-containing protein n=1 Tax=Caenorhabditis briggsae TaxID=6238 RepID=A0AAE9ERQ7_CAEBR|nr:hypothetical protein L3Y34_002972 [Caenorhabditis briggsae]UMM26427.1 hypothetical protein L5515_010132 [Caenorhabditis briggsae]
MSDELQQQLANSSLYDAESLKAFNQMYTSANNPYAVGGAGVVHGFDKNYPAAFPTFFAQHFAPYANPSSFSPSSTSSTSSTSSQQTSTKKKPVPVPNNLKDESYYERRARNNKAAQKSREARKKIDAENSHRVNQLEMENNHLKAYIYKLYQENMMMKNQLVQHYPGVVDPAAASMPGF